MFTAYGIMHRRFCRPATSSVHYTISSRPLVNCVLNSHLKRVTIPDAALIQFDPPEDEHNSVRNM